MVGSKLNTKVFLLWRYLKYSWSSICNFHWNVNVWHGLSLIQLEQIETFKCHPLSLSACKFNWITTEWVFHTIATVYQSNFIVITVIQNCLVSEIYRIHHPKCHQVSQISTCYHASCQSCPVWTCYYLLNSAGYAYSKINNVFK